MNTPQVADSRPAVAPAELENVLISHPDIVDAGLIGVPDPADPHNELPR